MLLFAAQVAVREPSATVYAPPTSPMVSSRVLPILDECKRETESDEHERDNGYSEEERQLALLFGEQTAIADEALAILTWVYLGEAPSEDLDHQISTRGKRMLPYLIKYRVRCPEILERYPVRMRLPEATRRSALRSLLRSMRKGEVVGED
jgi:hypothetical protein